MDILLNRNFKLWAYTVSHSCLIIRSPMFIDDFENQDKSSIYNIDIEFSSVTYLDIPSSLNGLSIVQCTQQIPDKFKDYIRPDLQVFEIRSQGKSYTIISDGYRIGKNKWISDDRITNMNLEYEEILYSSHEE